MPWRIGTTLVSHRGTRAGYCGTRGTPASSSSAWTGNRSSSGRTWAAPALAVGPTGAIILALYTFSPDFPTKNALSTDCPTHGLAAAVVKIDVVEPPPPAAAVCAFLHHRVPPVAIADALANPQRVPGWGELCNPSLPPGRLNYLRTWLSLQNTAVPYHPVGNALVYKCRCP